MHTDSVSGNWTQQGLAEQVGVSRQTIITIEKGSYNPSLQLAFKLARVFEVSIEELFKFQEEENEA
jgi:putative transcriptional regulator